MECLRRVDGILQKNEPRLAAREGLTRALKESSLRERIKPPLKANDWRKELFFALQTIRVGNVQLRPYTAKYLQVLLEAHPKAYHEHLTWTRGFLKC